jgi:hypothetical protein
VGPLDRGYPAVEHSWSAVCLAGSFVQQLEPCPACFARSVVVLEGRPINLRTLSTKELISRSMSVRIGVKRAQPSPDLGAGEDADTSIRFTLAA